MSLDTSRTTRQAKSRNNHRLTGRNFVQFANLMPRDPDISVRRWIKWSDSDAEEPTSTLVLSSPGSSYVDVRALLPTSSNSQREQRLPATTLEVLHNCSLPVADSSISHLDWAFAGTSFRTTATADQPTHGVWKRWVDSWQPNSKAHLLKDEGDLFPHYDGAEELELEKGSMVHPESGLMKDYEELWASGSANVVGNESSKRLCVVLRTAISANHSELLAPAKDDEERGVIIQVGQWIQGIVKRGENLLVERWVWQGAGNPGETNVSASKATGGWQRVVHIRHIVDGGEAVSLPCAALLDPDSKFSEGHVLDGEGPRWIVEEVVRW